MDWPLERILQLAPQPLLIDRARLLLRPRQWASLGFNQSLIWGFCRTKGATRYKVAFDLQLGQGFSNSPAPVKPDKYILALLLLFQDDASLFMPTPYPPDWVTEGMARPPAAPMASNTTSPSRLSGFDKRLPLMVQGQQELAQWLRDVARQGLGALQAAEPTTWETIASRLTDAKLGGLANRLRRLATQRERPDWDKLFRQEIAALYLWSEAFARFDDQTDSMQQELMLQGGWTPRKEDILRESAGVEDCWFVLSHTIGAEEQLAFQRTWFWGQDTGKTALVLEYAWGNTPFETQWSAGTGYQGAMHFYPGTFPLRAVPGLLSPVYSPFHPQTGLFAHFRELGDAFARAVAQQPWMEELPCGVASVTSVVAAEGNFFRDQLQYLIPLATTAGSALPESSPQTILGAWNGTAFKPWATYGNNQLIIC